MKTSSRVLVLVKALPQPSKRYGETVCCAGVTARGEWKRLFPVRYRHLQGGAFSRWDWVTFDSHPPTNDRRAESCHVHEESLQVDGRLTERERAEFLNPLILGSAAEAMRRSQSLALIRPKNTKFIWRSKPDHVLAAEREAFSLAARQMGMFDKELASIEPSPFHFAFKFDDAAGSHTYSCGDWEAHAMFWNGRRRWGEAECLRWMNGTFNDEYPRRGMAFAIGNQAKRPRTWQLLGVLRLDEVAQTGFLF